jgi:uncharacterized protein
MIFAWDQRKSRLNRRKHGVSFEAAVRVFQDPGAVSYVERVVEGEERWHTIGLAEGVVPLLVVHTVEEENGEEKIRIISARKADSRERALYDSHQEGRARRTPGARQSAGFGNRLLRCFGHGALPTPSSRGKILPAPEAAGQFAHRRGRPGVVPLPGRQVPDLHEPGLAAGNAGPRPATLSNSRLHIPCYGCSVILTPEVGIPGAVNIYPARQ